jgi:N-acetylmuramoyl-L-alanine amidase
LAQAEADAIIEPLRGTAASTVALLVLLAAAWPQAQGTPPATPLTLISRDGRRPVPTTIVGGQELVALDDVAALFRATLREDTLAGGVTLTYNGRTIIASPDQPMASVSGRVVTLPSPVVRSGRRWLVPIEFVSRALAPIYDQRIELRRTSRLLIVGDVRVPRVTARIDAPGPPTRATIDISPAAPVVATVENGRVLLRIDADALDLGLPAAGAGLIEQIRAGDQPNSIAVTLSAAATARAAVSTSDNAAHVAIEVQGPGAPADSGAAAPRPGVPSAEPVPLPTARAGVQTIVIDPGHGGDDVGAHGSAGVQEKEFTLDVARRLRAAIEMRLGIRVVLTRDEDRSVPLDERAAIANNSKASLFLSLHANASLSPKVTGAEVYHLKVDREVEAARREAAAEAVTMPVLGGGSRTIDVIRWDLAQARHVDQSAMLSSLLREDLGSHGVPLAARAEREAPLRVLEAADMPAALIEIAYLTNTSQEALASSDTFRNTVVQSLYDSIVRFRSHLEQAR